MIAGVMEFLIDADDPKAAQDIMTRVMMIAAGIGMNAIVDFAFPAPAVAVEPSAYQLQERQADYIGGLIAGSTRH